MANGLMQQDAGPTSAEYDFHCAGRCVDGFELHNSLSRGFCREMLRRELIVEKIESIAPAAACITRLQVAVIIGNARYVQSRERLHIANEQSLGRGDHYDFKLIHKRALHFANTPIA